MFSLAVTFSSAAVFAFLGIVFSFLANANYMFIFLSARMNIKTVSGKAVNERVTGISLCPTDSLAELDGILSDFAFLLFNHKVGGK